MCQVLGVTRRPEAFNLPKVSWSRESQAAVVAASNADARLQRAQQEQAALTLRRAQSSASRVLSPSARILRIFDIVG